MIVSPHVIGAGKGRAPRDAACCFLTRIESQNLEKTSLCAPKERLAEAGARKPLAKMPNAVQPQVFLTVNF